MAERVGTTTTRPDFCSNPSHVWKHTICAYVGALQLDPATAPRPMQPWSRTNPRPMQPWSRTKVRLLLPRSGRSAPGRPLG